jgi:hypothetical protein
MMNDWHTSSVLGIKHYLMRGRFWLLGAFVLIGSFLTTFWLTATPNSPLTILVHSGVSDDEHLSDAAISAGLWPSLTLKGAVETVSRLSADQVKIVGWSADREGDGMPIAVIAFTDGKAVLQTKTNGPRADLSDSLKLADAAALNVAFEGVLSCRPGRPLFVVAITGNSYTKLTHQNALLCPP